MEKMQQLLLQTLQHQLMCLMPRLSKYAADWLMMLLSCSGIDFGLMERLQCSCSCSPSGFFYVKWIRVFVLLTSALRFLAFVFVSVCFHFCACFLASQMQQQQQQLPLLPTLMPANTSDFDEFQALVSPPPPLAPPGEISALPIATVHSLLFR